MNYYNNGGDLPGRRMEKMMVKIEDVKVGDYFRLIKKPDAERRIYWFPTNFDDGVFQIIRIDHSDDTVEFLNSWWASVEDIEIVDVVVTPRSGEGVSPMRVALEFAERLYQFTQHCDTHWSPEYFALKWGKADELFPDITTAFPLPTKEEAVTWDGDANADPVTVRDRMYSEELDEALGNKLVELRRIALGLPLDEEEAS